MTKKKSAGRSSDQSAEPRFDFRKPIKTTPSDIGTTAQGKGNWLLEHTANIEKEEAQRVAAEAEEKAKQQVAKVERKIPPPLPRRRLTTTKGNGGSDVRTQPSRKNGKDRLPEEHPTLASFWPFPYTSPPGATHNTHEPSTSDDTSSEIPQTHAEVLASLLSLADESKKFADLHFTRRFKNLLEELSRASVDTSISASSEYTEHGNMQDLQMIGQTGVSFMKVGETKFRVSLLGKEVLLTSRAFNLFKTIVEADGKRVSREFIAERYEINKSSVSLKVTYLVADLNKSHPMLGAAIKSERGIGYYFELDS